MQESSLNERITRSLAYMLRHRPDEFDLELDDSGYADFEDVVRALNERLGEPVREEDVLEAIESGDRPRYELADGMIRALYGHSIEIDPGEPSEPPERLYIAVGARDAERARRHGLSSGRRTFLHLALAPEEAVESGSRLPYDWMLVTIKAAEADEDGVAFYDRQALFLCEHVPTRYLEFGELREGAGPRWGARRGAPRRDRPEPERHEPERREPERREPERHEPERREPERRHPAPAERAETPDEPVREPLRAAERPPVRSDTMTPVPPPQVPRPAAARPAPPLPAATDFGLGVFDRPAQAEPASRSAADEPASARATSRPGRRDSRGARGQSESERPSEQAPARQPDPEDVEPTSDSRTEDESTFGTGIL